MQKIHIYKDGQVIISKMVSFIKSKYYEAGAPRFLALVKKFKEIHFVKVGAVRVEVS